MQIDLGTSLSGLRQAIVAGDSVPTQWGDFPANSNELPPSYVLVDQETDEYFNDYTAESNANVLTADDGNEVSATITEVDFNTNWILAAWVEGTGSANYPTTENGNYFNQSNINNSSFIFDSANFTPYGEITSSNTPTISNDSIVIRMKHSGDAPFQVNAETGYLNHISQSTQTFNTTESFADYTISSFSRDSSTLDSRRGFYLRFNVVTTGTTTLHIDKIAVVEV